MIKIIRKVMKTQFYKVISLTVGETFWNSEAPRLECADRTGPSLIQDNSPRCVSIV